MTAGKIAIRESTDRCAWTQYEEQGRGSGFNAYKHKQPDGMRHKDLQRDYYVKTNGFIS